MSTDQRFNQLVFPALGDTSGLAEAQARTRGHASGYAAGMRAAEATLRAERQQAEAEHAELLDAARRRADSLAALLAAAVDAVNERTAPVLDQAQQAVATASIELAEAIIGVELADGETAARSIVARTLRTVDPAVVLVVRVHPETLAALDEPALVTGVTYTADATLQPGDAVVDFADGYLDARIDTAIARARAALLEGPA
jgi:flagellar assembly protein FliH